MSLGLRLSLLLPLIAGCAAQRLEVPDSDWETVPAPTRAAVDRQIAADLAAAQAELAAATTGLAELQRTLPRAPVSPAPVSPAPAPAPQAAAGSPADPGDEWTTTLQYQQRARREAFVRVETAKTAWQRADLSWREARLAAAKERIDMVVCQRELVRAQTIDHNLPGTDTYNVAPLRGQFSQVQQRWYIASNAARQARSAFEHASAQLASVKEAYAQVMRNVPLSTSVAVAASDDRPPSLQLTGWAVTRADIRRRRGLRHFLDEVANAPPQLRKTALRLTVRAVPAAPPAAVATTAAPATEVRGSGATPVAPASMHPADAAAAGLSTGPGAGSTAAKPAGHPGPPASSPSAGKSAPATAQASPPSPSGAAARPGATSPGVPASTRPAPAGSQTSASTAPATAVAKPGPPTSPDGAPPVTGKPAPSTAPAGPPVATGAIVTKPASPTTPVSSGGKPAPGDGKPAAPVAKPID
jgi:hypothetical protein